MDRAARQKRAEGAAADPGEARRGTGWVVEKLRAAITTGQLSPNERLVEADLAAEYGVGRAMVRAALLELDKEGLIVREQGRGARVRALTLDEAIEIAEVRMVNEGLCAAKAAERVTRAEIKELQGLVTDMKQAHAKGDLLYYSELNQLLHRRIREMSRHSTAAATVEQLRNRSARQSFRLALLPGRTAISLKEHEKIVGAIGRRDPEGAREAMHTHLRSVVDALRELGASAVGAAGHW